MIDSRRRSFAQRAMEARPIVRVYESRLWRRSGVVRFVLGISFEREYLQILAAAGLQAASDVLDLACGSGIYTRPFARALPTGTIVGLDLSRPMLAYAHESASRAGLKNLLLVRGDAMRLPFPNARFDLVTPAAAPVSDAGRGGSGARAAGGRHGRRGASRRGHGAAGRRPAAFGRRSFAPRELAARLHAAGLGGVRSTARALADRQHTEGGSAGPRPGLEPRHERTLRLQRVRPATRSTLLRQVALNAILLRGLHAGVAMGRALAAAEADPAAGVPKADRPLRSCSSDFGLLACPTRSAARGAAPLPADAPRAGHDRALCAPQPIMLASWR
jgi:SAM-dependent methyltransferase